MANPPKTEYKDLIVEFEDNSDDVIKQLDVNVIKALYHVGLKAVSYAVPLTPVGESGNLRQSISFKVDDEEKAVYVGSPMKYAAYVELGTGIYYPEGGRPTPWVYWTLGKDPNTGELKKIYHFTHGMRAQPYIKPAMADHMKTYKRIIEDELKGE